MSQGENQTPQLSWDTFMATKPRATVPAKPVEVSSVSLSSSSSITTPPPADLPADATPEATEPEALSVSELNRSIKDLLEGQLKLIWVKAEISNFKAHTSGHFYFSLKDSKSQISAVMFRGFNQGLKFRPVDGMEVLVRGKITVYEPRGNYQIFCELMEPVGAGALQKAFEQLKGKLQAEGLFDSARKRALPALPKHIAIVTSPTGAAIRDMLNVLGRRFKGVRITLFPVKVQGAQAAGEVAQAIAQANAMAEHLGGVDVMIIGRGGGSIEDMWAFNEEIVARAIAASVIPTISAVGHEIDFTIADFVADLRAPTPSAAAELVVKNAADITRQLAQFQRALQQGLARHLGDRRRQVLTTSRRLVDPQRRLQDMSLRCDELAQRLQQSVLRPLKQRQQELRNLSARSTRAAQGILQIRRQRWSGSCALLDSLSPLRTVDRGYAIATDKQKKVIRSISQVTVGDQIQIQLAVGALRAQVLEIENKKGDQSDGL